MSSGCGGEIRQVTHVSPCSHREAVAVGEEMLRKFPESDLGACLMAEAVFGGVLWDRW